MLKLWLHLLGYVQGEAGEGLIGVANELDLPKRALLLLQSGARHERLVAMRVAAALRLTEAIAPLQEKAAQARPHSSLEAASALLKISAPHGLEALRDLLGRIDWAPGPMADMLKPSGEAATAMLADLLARQPQGSGTPVLRLIGLLDDYSSVAVLRERLRENRDEQEIAVILHALGKLGGAEERAAAIGFLEHPGWLVRMQAAASLAELGMREDWKRLLPLIGDSHWWVRYRAARSLFKLGGAEALAAARAAVSDPYANDMLDRVQAEC